MTTQQVIYENSRVTARAGAALTRNRLVTFGAVNSAGELTVTHSTAAGRAHAVVEESTDSGGLATVRLLPGISIFTATAAAAITALTPVYQTAAGKVDDDETLGARVGIALEAASADGNFIRVLSSPANIRQFRRIATSGEVSASTTVDFVHNQNVATPKLIGLTIQTSAGVQRVTAYTLTFPDANTARVVIAALTANDILSLTLGFDGV